MVVIRDGLSERFYNVWMQNFGPKEHSRQQKLFLSQELSFKKKKKSFEEMMVKGEHLKRFKPPKMVTFLKEKKRKKNWCRTQMTFSYQWRNYNARQS